MPPVPDPLRQGPKLRQPSKPEPKKEQKNPFVKKLSMMKHQPDEKAINEYLWGNPEGPTLQQATLLQQDGKQHGS